MFRQQSTHIFLMRDPTICCQIYSATLNTCLPVFQSCYLEANPTIWRSRSITDGTSGRSVLDQLSDTLTLFLKSFKSELSARRFRKHAMSASSSQVEIYASGLMNKRCEGDRNQHDTDMIDLGINTNLIRWTEHLWNFFVLVVRPRSIRLTALSQL